jgi:hypothetical protein
LCYSDPTRTENRPFCFIALNGLAWIQARAATHFVADGQPLDKLLTLPLPERLWTLAIGVKIPRPQNP